MIEAMAEGFVRAATLQGLMLVILGTCFGMLMGMLPGLSGGMGMVLLVPVTFGWPLDDALLVVAATWGASAFAGSVTAILIGVPGDAINAITVLDGYPLARQGRGLEALAASALASALGATFGVGFLILMIPIMRRLVLLFGPAEFFSLAILGLAVIAVASGGLIHNGLVSAVLGLLLGLHGFNIITGESRFDFGFIYLYDGVPLIPVFIGIFAFTQALSLALHRSRVAEVPVAELIDVRQILRGFKAVFTNFGVFLRSCAIGLVVGAIPGPGGTLANFIVYAQAKAAARDGGSQFGRGDIRGVIAPETSNDVKDGASLLPTLAFGVPGTIGAGFLLLAFQFHGVRPGPRILGPELGTVFVLLIGLVSANWLSSLLGVLFSRWLVRITILPTAYISGVVLVLALVGGVAPQGQFFHGVVVVVFGVVGYVLGRADIPVIPLVIALLLSPLLEESFHQAYQIGGGTLSLFVTRPIATGLLGVALIIALWPLFRSARARIIR